MKVFLTRDSVSAGDDVDAPHERSFSIANDWTWDALVSRTLESANLPLIKGGKATWALSSNVPIAVHAQEWDRPVLIQKATFDQDAINILDNEIRMHWSYFAQLDPDLVLEVLNHLQLHANKLGSSKDDEIST